MYTLISSPYGWIPNENYSKMYNCTSKFVTKYIGFHNSRFENVGSLDCHFLPITNEMFFLEFWKQWLLICMYVTIRLIIYNI